MTGETVIVNEVIIDELKESFESVGKTFKITQEKEPEWSSIVT